MNKPEYSSSSRPDGLHLLSCIPKDPTRITLSTTFVVIYIGLPRRWSHLCIFCVVWARKPRRLRACTVPHMSVSSETAARQNKPNGQLPWIYNETAYSVSFSFAARKYNCQLPCDVLIGKLMAYIIKHWRGILHSVK